MISLLLEWVYSHDSEGEMLMSQKEGESRVFKFNFKISYGTSRQPLPPLEQNFLSEVDEVVATLHFPVDRRKEWIRQDSPLMRYEMKASALSRKLGHITCHLMKNVSRTKY